MVDRPVLIFPGSTRVDREKLSRLNIPRPSRPGTDRQRKRLAPKFERLQKLFETENAKLQTGPSGLVPEKVLVLEAVEPLDRFARAVELTTGLEWLAEMIDEFDPLPFR